MPAPVKRDRPRRRYDATRRREQAEATRLRILSAAQRRFEADGYAATTIAGVAADAGVAVKTVYLSFESKSGLLRALWHRLLRGEKDTVPVGEQDWFRDPLSEPDPERRLRVYAGTARRVKSRIGPLLEVIRTAAPGDAEIAALWGRIQTDFHANQRTIVESLAADGALRADLGVDRATDLMWTLNHPANWHLLVTERGWSHDEFEAWLADAFCTQLLDAGGGAGRRRA